MTIVVIINRERDQFYPMQRLVLREADQLFQAHNMRDINEIKWINTSTSAGKLTPQVTQQKRSDPMSSSKYCKNILKSHEYAI